MARITIDGKPFVGNSISMVNGKVVVDGVEQGGTLEGRVELHITGTLNVLETDAAVNMNGTINGAVTAGGSVNCDDVGGNVFAGGSVKHG